MPAKKVDPIPTSFNSAEEAGEFWDTHDTMDYEDVLRDVQPGTVELRHRYAEVEIEMGVVQALRTEAHQRGISVSDLASELLRQQLKAA